MNANTIDPRHILNIQGRDFVRFEGLLDLAHRNGLNVVETNLVQAPTEGNGGAAIVRAQVMVERGTFSGIGDANPKNVNPKIVPHIIRMAETRAVARALRLACNIGMCSVEELEGEPEPAFKHAQAPAPSPNPAQAPKRAQNGPTAPQDAFGKSCSEYREALGHDTYKAVLETLGYTKDSKPPSSDDERGKVLTALANAVNREAANA